MKGLQQKFEQLNNDYRDPEPLPLPPAPPRKVLMYFKKGKTSVPVQSIKNKDLQNIDLIETVMGGRTKHLTSMKEIAKRGRELYMTVPKISLENCRRVHFTWNGHFTPRTIILWQHMRVATEVDLAHYGRPSATSVDQVEVDFETFIYELEKLSTILDMSYVDAREDASTRCRTNSLRFSPAESDEPPISSFHLLFLTRLRDPPLVYLLEELESKYKVAYKILLDLVELDDDNTQDRKRPSLRHLPEMIEELAQILQTGEIRHRERKFESEFTLYLDVAYQLQNWDSSWLWLANEFYNLAASRSKGFIGDTGFGEALINYLFGKFLLVYMNDFHGAIEHLEKAWILSLGQPWTIDFMTKTREDNIHKGASYLLHIILVQKAEEAWRQEDTSNAIMYMRKALRKVKESEKHPDIEEVLLKLAMFYLRIHESCNARPLLSTMLIQCKKENDGIGICNACFGLALCYKSWTFSSKALSYLNELLFNAEKWQIESMEATAKQYLGEHYLFIQPSIAIAAGYFEQAYKLFVKIKHYKDAEGVAPYCAVTRYLKYFPTFAKLFQLAYTDENALNALLNYEVSKEPFWKEITLGNGRDTACINDQVWSGTLPIEEQYERPLINECGQLRLEMEEHLDKELKKMEQEEENNREATEEKKKNMAKWRKIISDAAEKRQEEANFLNQEAMYKEKEHLDENLDRLIDLQMYQAFMQYLKMKSKFSYERSMAKVAPWIKSIDERYKLMKIEKGEDLKEGSIPFKLIYEILNGESERKKRCIPRPTLLRGVHTNPDD